MTSRVLDAAELSFVTRGFQDTTIERLAQELGVTRRSIVSRYKSKDEMLIAVAIRDMERYSPQLFALEVREEHCWEDLETLIRKLWERGSNPKNAALLRAYLGEVVRLPHLAEAVRAFYYDISSIIESKIAAMQKYGMFRGYKASTVAACAISLVISNPRIRTMLFDPQFEDPVTVERYFTDIWTLIRAMA
ncbi:MAG: TetR/AcrR family transcriptional regulator [Mesorhizobium sp.]|nr:TetR/AcrR family transcriptional regulator [Mesorhizobium sp.]MCO5161282.1 TetR/AcrR family transcriptional regulator [Mesorhizobium sp.]